MKTPYKNDQQKSWLLCRKVSLLGVPPPPGHSAPLPWIETSLFQKPETNYNYSEIFYSCQFIKSFRPFHSFWEEEDLSKEINISFIK